MHLKLSRFKFTFTLGTTFLQMQIMHTKIEEITIRVQNEGLPQFVFVFLQRENKHDNTTKHFMLRLGANP
jgi:hypothetical protein